MLLLLCLYTSHPQSCNVVAAVFVDEEPVIEKVQLSNMSDRTLW